MKLKKACIYGGSLLGLIILFISCYYLSYQHALKDFNKRSVERLDYSLLQNNLNPTMLGNQQNDTIAVDTQADVRTTQTTKQVVEIFNRKTGETDTHILNIHSDYVSLTKTEIEEKVKAYMEDLDFNEINEGLQSYELIAFSEEQIRFRKVYDEDAVKFRYYVVIKDGKIVVYNSDLKTFYKYTQHEAKYLPETERIALSEGIYVKDEEELYSMLENYSSYHKPVQ